VLESGPSPHTALRRLVTANPEASTGPCCWATGRRVG
jgi:hypothetical protein